MPEKTHKPGQRTRWRRNGERGQSLVEFVLTAPILILLLLGMAEFGHGLNSYLTIVAAARDSARLGAQFGVNGGPGQALMHNVIADETGRLSNGPVDNDNCGTGQGICITSCVTSGPACTPITGSTVVDKELNVRVCYDHPMMIGIPLFMEGPINMCSSTAIRIAK